MKREDRLSFLQVLVRVSLGMLCLLTFWAMELAALSGAIGHQALFWAGCVAEIIVFVSLLFWSIEKD